MRLALFLLFLFAVLGALMATQDLNMTPVEFAIPYTDLQFVGPRLIVLGSTLLLGFALGYFSALPGKIGAAARARRAQRELEKVEAQRERVAVGRTESRAEARADLRAAEADARRHEADARAREADARETQRLADEVARRTAETRRDVPPPPPER
ncbi:MAG TPA: hypothetical protein VD962_07105 [Rubricoccaceae bacterium]|nr:hypothetical protein [Rubricoccaceae bacterium]